MPFIKEIETDFGIIGIWKFSESTDQLFSKFQFSANEKSEFSKLKSEKRRNEYLSTRLLLQNLLKKKVEIEYQESGKPILINCNLNISISHSSKFATVLISEHKIGIDVEDTNRNIERIAKRFLHKKEREYLNNLDNSQAVSVLYWSAKEAIFKCTDHQGVQFNEQIIISPFKIDNEREFTGTFSSNQTTINYKLGYFFYENNVVVYCVEEEN